MKRFVSIPLGILIFLLMLLSLLYLFQERMIFLSTELAQDHQFNLDYPYQEVFINREDGARLHGLHIKSPAAQPKGLILYFHGNKGDLGRWGSIAAELIAYDYDVLAVDYRGYGKSNGKRTEQLLYEDANQWYQWAKQHFQEEQLIVFGRSIGCTFATHAAQLNHPKKLILETPFYGLLNLVKERYPLLPFKQAIRFPFQTNQFISKVNAPIVVLHGTEDEVVPYEQGERLFELIAGEDNHFIRIEGGKHNDLINFSAYKEALQTELQ